MFNILVVDDEVNILELVRFNLEVNGYHVDTANDGKEAVNKALSFVYDLVILDVMMPEIDGFGVLKILKKNIKYDDVPILMLTAKSDENDKVLGLEIGADDYITKPFSVKELVARVGVLLRRYKKEDNKKEEGSFVINNLIMNRNSHTVKVCDVEIDLTLKEFEILEILCQNRGNVVKRDELLDKVWGEDYFGDSRSIDVHVRHIRAKINQIDKDNDYIETIRGVGYKIR